MKNYIRSSVIGFFFTLVLGTLLHFAYDFSGENFLVSLFAPTNESVWEHLKLLFFPFLLYTFIEMAMNCNSSSVLFTANMIGVVFGILTIPILFYSYTSILGKNYLWLDILTFILGIIVTFLIRNYLLSKHKINKKTTLLGYVIFTILIIAFFYFTLNPPQLGLFIDSSAKEQ